MIDENARSMKTQNERSALISTNISSISGIAYQVAQSAVQASASGHELSLMAGQLQGLVQQFLLSDRAEAEQGLTAGSTQDDNVELF